MSPQTAIHQTAIPPAAAAEAGPAIPVIDLAPLHGGGDGDSAVVAAIERACRSTGFFLVTGHGVPDTVVGRLYDLCRAFFDLPEPAKRALCGAPETIGGVAFAPMLQEALAATSGGPGGAPGDIKESLNYGPRLPGAPWPAAPEGLRGAFEAYFAEMERLARLLRRAFARAIGLPDDHFEPAFEDHLSALRVINYPEPEAPPAPGQLRAGAHTDYGFLTILRSEDAPGGLEVRTRSGDWLPVPAVRGAFVVNIADAFMRWTNDTWVSTPHRVANPPAGLEAGSRRQSIPFFLNPGAATVIRCLEPFCPPGTAARYEPITYGDYIALKTRQAFGQ